MPTVTGRSRHIPIIFITAASPTEPLPMFRGYESGMVDVLFKPINPEIGQEFSMSSTCWRDR